MLLIAMTDIYGRTWTDVRGRKIEAELVSADESKVVLKMPNGKNVTIRRETLGEEDQLFLELNGDHDEPDGSNESGKSNNGSAENDLDDEDLNWDDPWPDDIRYKEDPQIEVVSEDEEEKKFEYTSENYRFTCDVRLSKQVVSTFADMFEATRLYCRSLPLAVTGGKKNNGKYDILLFETKESYIKAGGPPSSAGVFMGWTNTVMVPLSSLGVRRVGSGYMRDRDKSDGTLIHEITHQLTPEPYYDLGARGWFSEGLAEYLTATKYRNGRFDIRGNFDDIREYATSFGDSGKRGRNLGTNISAPPLRDFMLMSYQEFAGDNANFNYGLGLLITTYFLHLDGEGDGSRMKDFLKALRRTHGNRAKSADGQADEVLKMLLDGRTFEELEADISKAWSRKRVDIVFGKAK